MIHIIQNDPEVPPGNIAANLDDHGLIYLVHHPYGGDPLPDERDISALIVLGGAMGANDDANHPFLAELKRFIRRCVRNGIPYLGICLGGQLLAAALGGRVVSNRWEELGTMPVELNEAGSRDPLFAGVEPGFVTFQWHHDSFDLPDGAALLASSPACPHQAFRIGHRAWGTQFHPEVTAGIIRDWCAWDPATEARCEALVAAWQAAQPAYDATAGTLLRNFLAAAGMRRSA